MTEGNGKSEIKKYALVVTHILNQNMVQGFPMWGVSPDACRVEVEACLAAHQSVPLRDSLDGEIAQSIILGAGMQYRIEEWDTFAANVAEMNRRAAEARAAAHLGVTLPGGGGRGGRG